MTNKCFFCIFYAFITCFASAIINRDRSYESQRPSDLFFALPQAIYQVAMEITFAILPSPSIHATDTTLNEKGALANDQTATATMTKVTRDEKDHDDIIYKQYNDKKTAEPFQFQHYNRTLVVVYKYPAVLFSSHEETSETTEAKKNERLLLEANSSPLVGFLKSLLHEIVMLPESVIKTSYQLAGFSPQELYRVRHTAQVSLDALADNTLRAQDVAAVQEDDVQRIQRGVVILRLLNSLINISKSFTTKAEKRSLAPNWMSDNKNATLQLGDKHPSKTLSREDVNGTNNIFSVGNYVSKNATVLPFPIYDRKIKGLIETESKMFKKRKKVIFHTMYLPTLHMESLEVPSEYEVETYKELLRNDPNVENVYLDAILHIPHSEEFSRSIVENVQTMPRPLSAKEHTETTHGKNPASDKEPLNKINGSFLRSFEVAKEPSVSKSNTTEHLFATNNKTTGSTIAANLTSDVKKRNLASINALSSPHDPLFDRQWSLQSTDRYQGAANIAKGWGLWSAHRSAGLVTVALLDSGVDTTHPDLEGRFWKNEEEVCNNGIDDDGNGYIDDCNGWDFITNTNQPIDENGHGTASAGIIAAIPNNGIGITPICWNCRIMNLRVLNAQNKGPLSGFLKAFDYALKKGVRISNNSYGGHNIQFAALNEAIKRARKRGMVFVAASGNYGSDNDIRQYTIYPSSFHHDNIISVAAVNEYGNLASFSNFGQNSVSIGAPGTNILTTALGGHYSFMSGTSFAAPHVTALVALLWSLNPHLDYREIIRLIMNSARELPSMNDRTTTGGVIDALASLELAVRGGCAPGYVRNEKNKCLDINECLEDPGICPQLRGVRCINYPGTFECRCPEGTAWDGVPYGSCRVIQYPFIGSCKLNGPCGANSLCHSDLFSGVTCVCLRGYIKYPNADLCIRQGVETKMKAEQYLQEISVF